MFNNTDLHNALVSAKEQLQFIVSELNVITYPPITPITINLQQLTSKEDIRDLLKDVPNGSQKEGNINDYVYVISIGTEEGKLLTTLLEHLEVARLADGDYCRINRKHEGTKTLYVGRSKKLKSRLNQHLGTEHHGTYSLHLQRWATKIEGEITISYMKFENYYDQTMQAIEDGLWVSLKPAFGRKGYR